MANTFFNPDAIARLSIGLLYPDLVLARTVNRDYEADFVGGKGNVVNVRRPITLASSTRAYGATSAISVTDITEPTTVPVTIDEMIYSAVKVTDEDMTLGIEDFGRQVLQPQTTAVARAIEAKVVAEMRSLTPHASLEYVSGTTDPVKFFTSARKILRDLNVAPGGMVAAVGTGIAADLLNAKDLQDAGQSGSTGALRDATIGRLKGFDVIEVNTLNDDEAIFYSRDAFTLALRAPAVPDGVSFGRSVSANGFAVRWIKDYDASVLADRSILSVFAGTEKMTVRDWDSGAYVTPAIRVDGPIA